MWEKLDFILMNDFILYVQIYFYLNTVKKASVGDLPFGTTYENVNKQKIFIDGTLTFSPVI